MGQKEKPNKSSFQGEDKKICKMRKKNKSFVFQNKQTAQLILKKNKKETNMNVEVKKNEHKKNPYVYCFILLLSVHKFKFWVFN